MSKSNRKNNSKPDHYEDIIRLERLDPYETLIYTSDVAKRKQE